MARGETKDGGQGGEVLQPWRKDVRTTKEKGERGREAGKEKGMEGKGGREGEGKEGKRKEG